MDLSSEAERSETFTLELQWFGKSGHLAELEAQFRKDLNVKGYRYKLERSVSEEPEVLELQASFISSTMKQHLDEQAKVRIVIVNGKAWPWEL